MPTPVILVSLKTDDGEGSALLACTGVKKDPLLTTHVILENVTGLLWPFEEKIVRVNQWSVNKKSINHWMFGQLHSREASLTLEDLERAKKVPRPPGTTPEQTLSNDVEAVEKLGAEPEEKRRGGKKKPSSKR